MAVSIGSAPSDYRPLPVSGECLPTSNSSGKNAGSRQDSSGNPHLGRFQLDPIRALVTFISSPVPLRISRSDRSTYDRDADRAGSGRPRELRRTVVERRTGSPRQLFIRRVRSSGNGDRRAMETRCSRTVSEMVWECAPAARSTVAHPVSPD